MSERSTYTPELPQKLEAEFSGFTPDQETHVRQGIEDIGMPTDNIKKFTSKKPRRGEEKLRGTYQPDNEELSLYEPPKEEPPVAQQDTLVHEISHSNTPFNPKNERLFGNREELEITRNHIIAVAKQSTLTRKYLNGYQAYLHQQLEAGKIDSARFVEETHAIMVELRFTNPKHLEEVEKAQLAAIKKMNRNNQGSAVMPVAIMTSDVEAQRGNLVGVDRTISRLIPKLKTKEDIDNHVARVRQNFLKRGPIFPNQIKKAA